MQFVSGFGCVSNSYFTVEYEYSGKHMSYSELTTLGGSSIGNKNTHKTASSLSLNLIHFLPLTPLV
jgi:hypothetical protein